MSQIVARTAILEFPGFVIADQDVSDIELDLLLTEDQLIVLVQQVVVA